MSADCDHPFGDVVPGEAVTIKDVDPRAGYRPKGQWVRRGDGKRIRLPDTERPETSDRTRKD